MCGFSGFLTPGGAGSAQEMTARAVACGDALVHRGPDGGDTWVDAEAGIALAHRRLAVIDLSEAGKQPMTSHCGRFVIAYNGEVYNFTELRADLETHGHQFRGHSDTEVLLQGFVAWGVAETLRRANGMFAFALWDRRDRILTLGRDRFGQKPLYYGAQGGTVLFGSELRALRAHPAFAACIDREAVTLFMRRAAVPAPLTIHEGILKLVPGCTVTIDGTTGAIGSPEPYWSAIAEAEAGLADPFRGSAEEAVEALDTLLRDAVGACMVSDVPLGSFLSGGIDSSTVTALMQAQSATPVRTFSIGFDVPGFNEAEHAKAVANHLGTDHTELYLTPTDAQNVIPRLPGIYDEPFADASQIPTVLVSELARRHVTVGLSGDGGDELFCGYNRYGQAFSLARRLSALPTGLLSVAAAGMKQMPAGAYDGMAKLLPGLRRVPQVGEKAHKFAEILDAPDVAAVYHRLTSTWQDPASAVIDGREPPTLAASGAQWPALDGPIHQMMLVDSLTYMPDDILTKVDRAAMSVSLEGRIPLLDHRVFAFAWRLPLALKTHNGQGKWPMRAVLNRYVPASIIDRPKMGFSVPIGTWLRTDLREWAEDLLSEDALRAGGVLNPAPIRRIWAEHQSGRRQHDHRLWCALMFQAWHRAHAEAA